jgi:hypothetical protein
MYSSVQYVNRQGTQIIESSFISDRFIAIISNMYIYSTHCTVKSVNTMAVCITMVPMCDHLYNFVLDHFFLRQIERGLGWIINRCKYVPNTGPQSILLYPMQVHILIKGG